ncbi:acyltransferase [Morganella morganii]|uniref:acyltransferase family protein n=1 Tax=Morganella morganii TaxID=582 RepID=UPI00301D5906
MQNYKEKTKIESIQVIRGVAALFVVLFHYKSDINNIYAQENLGDLLFSFGWIGVDLFFLISGFIIYKSTEIKKPVKEFVIKRFFRVYPPYIFCLFLFLFFYSYVNADLPSVLQLIKSIMLVPLNHNDYGPFYGYSVLSVAWTLSYELAFYFIFAVSMYFSHKYRFYISSIIIIILVTTFQVFYLSDLTLTNVKISTSTTSNHILSNLFFLANPIFLEFIAGMLVAKAYHYISNSFKNTKLSLIIVTLILSYAITLILSGHYTSHGFSLYGGALPSLLILICLIRMESAHNIKMPKAFVFLGAISYSLYLVHSIVPFIISDIGIEFPDASGFTILVFNLLVSICLSVCIYTYIEKPTISASQKTVIFLQKK